MDDDDDVHHSLEAFLDNYPVFQLLGTVYHVGSGHQFDVDGEVQLVCKYLKSKKDGNLDRLAKSKY